MKKILLIVADSSFFLSHRLSLSCALKAKGYEVVVATSIVDPKHLQIINNHGFIFADLKKRSKGFDWMGTLALLFTIRSLIAKLRPHVIISVSIRMTFISLLARLFALLPQSKFMGMLTGLGFLAVTKNRLYQLVNKSVMLVLKALCAPKAVNLMVQNKDDYEVLTHVIDSSRLFIVLGSGVDIEHFRPSEQVIERKNIVVTMVARMLRDKGIDELIEAARRLKQHGNPRIIIQLVGDIHEGNPSSCRSEELQKWTQEGIVTWLGPRDDIAQIYQASDIAILPSYREGLPKSLLEAAACALPLIATNVPGCREICVNDYNGYLVPVKDPQGLVEAILRLADDESLRKVMGQAGRLMVESKLSDSIINSQMIEMLEGLS